MDTLLLKSGIHGVATSVIPLAGSFDGRPSGLCQVSAAGRSNVDKSKVVAPPQKTSTSPSSSRFSFRYPLKSTWFGSNSGGDDGISMANTSLVETEEKSDSANSRIKVEFETPVVPEDRDGNWMLKFLHLQPRNKEEDLKGTDGEVLEKGLSSDLDRECSSAGPVEEDSEKEELCDACRVHFDGEVEFEIDRDTFSRFLHRVSLDQAKLYAKMAYLGNLAYGISDIKPKKLLKSRGLKLVTSSVEKRKLATKAVEELFFSKPEPTKAAAKDPEKEGSGYQINPSSIAYQVAASAASYVHSHMKDILSAGPSNEEESKELPDDEIHNTINPDMVSFMAATDSVTSVVAAEEEVKQALANDLNSTYSSPCEWFICDDDDSGTRFFVIQGSESLASWQANLLFEPVEFEGLDILVHRGIYEAAKGIYKQILPEVRAHLNTHGNHATFRFTGHSLGGSLSVLINLMLLIRGEVPLSSLLPVITFGAPSIMCGGDRLLRKLGLPRSHVQAVTLHRDIVPRAFSCTYPDHVAKLLKAMNGSFRDHPCLKYEKILYAPVGELLILQPDKKFSPQHHLLPSGSGLYFLTCTIPDTADEQKKHLQAAAEKLFFNSPHPLEILSDRSAYGTGGTIQRDHDISSYLKSVQTVVRQELKRIRKAKRERRKKLWWPVVLLSDINDRIVLDRRFLRRQVNLFGVLENSQELLRRLGRHLASQRMDLFMVLLFPARLLLLGTINIH